MIVGTGRLAEDGDRITVDYTGNLLSGKEFDSSKTSAPITFTLGKHMVIKGWDLGFSGMKVGGRRVLSIPPSMAYGDRELEGIPKNSTLVFDVRLLRVDKANDKPAIEIEELAPGAGPASKAGDTVDVFYTGMFLNGTKFDSNVGKSTFSVKLGSGGVIKGFDQGLTGMKAGGKRRVTIPSELAYGSRGAGGVIPPDAALIFEIEITKIH
ncbi:MAG: FKBP-type peptidyl-prolyl cis-trans isomerase [Armatimonadetes bacterium]|nr:FKBP-type peptidyl-prolyl cis-trans isomerase [Armatimonadota bacterium]